MSKVSIITTAYKHQDFIAQTIESILLQTYTDWELLIGDDSGDNATRDSIQSYVNKYPTKIKAWHHSPNKWIVDNINFLIAQSSPNSEYVAFLEWDDMYASENIQKKLEIFQKYPDVKLVYSDLDFVKANWTTLISSYLQYRRIPLFQNKILQADEFLAYTTWPIASRSTWMIRKDVLQSCFVRSIEPQKKNYQVSDYDFYFQVATKYPIYWISESLTKYRRHESNLSWKNGWTSSDLEQLVIYYQKNNLISNLAYKKKIGRTKIVGGFWSFEVWDKKEWIRFLKESFNYWVASYLPYKIFLGAIYLLPKNCWSYIIKKIIGRN